MGEFKDQFERHQQKQVDVHLATDILTWAYTWDRACHLAVVSDDIDLLPALGAAAFVPAASAVASALAPAEYRGRALGTVVAGMTVAQVAESEGVSARTVLRWIERGHLRARRQPGRRLRIHRDWYAEMVEQGELGGRILAAVGDEGGE